MPNAVKSRAWVGAASKDCVIESNWFIHESDRRKPDGFGVKSCSFRIYNFKQLLNNLFYMLTSLVSLQQGNVKKSEKLMKIVNIEDFLHIF